MRSPKEAKHELEALIAEISRSPLPVPAEKIAELTGLWMEFDPVGYRAFVVRQETRKASRPEGKDPKLGHVLKRKVRGDDEGRTWEDVLWALHKPGASRGTVAREFGITRDAIKKKFPKSTRTRETETRESAFTRALVELARDQVRSVRELPAVLRQQFADGRIEPAPWVQLDVLLERVAGELRLTPAEVVALETIKMVLDQVRRAEEPGEKR